MLPTIASFTYYVLYELILACFSLTYQGREDFLTVHLFKKRGGFRVYYLEECWQVRV